MNELLVPQEGEYQSYYTGYVNWVKGKDIPVLLLDQVSEIKRFYLEMGEEKSLLAYEPGKWTAKEVLGHIIDTDRIMTFRALCFARGEEIALPGFDQDPYVIAGKFNQVSSDLLLQDFEAQRNALLTFINTLDESVLDFVGNANGKPITPRALLWIISGHFIHHFKILNERY